MNHNSHEVTHDDAPPAQLGKLQSAAMLVGGLLFLAFFGMVGTSSDAVRVELMQSYIYGFMCAVSISLGMLGLTLLHHTVRGSWGLSVIRLAEAGASARTFMLLALLYVPIIFFYKDLYPWANAATVAGDHVLRNKAAWMNPTAVAIRAFVLIGIWGLLANGLRKSSIRQDESNDENEAQTRTNWAAPGIVLLALTVTVAVTDWVMSLDPHWYSTMFGPLFIVGPGLGALALCSLLIGVNANRDPFKNYIRPNVTKDLGNMMLTFTMLWAYFNFSQFLIIWNGNLPTTAGYYYARSVEGWNAVGCALIVGQFFIPFVWLLCPSTKRHPMNLARVAGWLLVMRIVDIYYIVTPMYRTTGPMPHLADGIAFLSLMGLWTMVFCAQIKKASIYPMHDRRLLEATDHA